MGHYNLDDIAAAKKLQTWSGALFLWLIPFAAAAYFVLPHWAIWFFVGIAATGVITKLAKHQVDWLFDAIDKQHKDEQAAIEKDFQDAEDAKKRMADPFYGLGRIERVVAWVLLKSYAYGLRIIGNTDHFSSCCKATKSLRAHNIIVKDIRDERMFVNIVDTNGDFVIALKIWRQPKAIFRRGDIERILFTALDEYGHEIGYYHVSNLFMQCFGAIKKDCRLYLANKALQLVSDDPVEPTEGLIQDRMTDDDMAKALADLETSL